jgi:hypothetical protein
MRVNADAARWHPSLGVDVLVAEGGTRPPECTARC